MRMSHEKKNMFLFLPRDVCGCRGSLDVQRDPKMSREIQRCPGRSEDADDLWGRPVHVWKKKKYILFFFLKKKNRGGHLQTRLQMPGGYLPSPSLDGDKDICPLHPWTEIKCIFFLSADAEDRLEMSHKDLCASSTFFLFRSDVHALQIVRNPVFLLRSAEKQDVVFTSRHWLHWSDAGE